MAYPWQTHRGPVVILVARISTTGPGIQKTLSLSTGFLENPPVGAIAPRSALGLALCPHLAVRNLSLYTPLIGEALRGATHQGASGNS